MNSSACSLFEGDYHFGLGVLLNSIYSNGFRGVFWVGYRGDLPKWASPIKHEGNFVEFQAAKGFCVRFVKLQTGAHLTNYKPDFMLQVLNSFDPDCDALFYFDADLVVSAPWIYFEEWVTHGVAFCEDYISPIPISHLWRVDWRNTFAKLGIKLNPRDACYANGGFIGLRRSEIEFLLMWKRIQDLIWGILGGNEFACIPGGKKIHGHSTFSCFFRTDQDALNASIEATSEIPFSFLGEQAMGFIGYPPILPHASLRQKPWRRNYLLDALLGFSPLSVDKAYWGSVSAPIPIYNSWIKLAKKIEILISIFIGRFYRKS